MFRLAIITGVHRWQTLFRGRLRVCTDTHNMAGWNPPYVRQRTGRRGVHSYHRTTTKIGSRPVNMTFSFAPVVALIAGVLILVMPRLLNYIVALYLIITGLFGLFGSGSFHMH